MGVARSPSFFCLLVSLTAALHGCGGRSTLDNRELGGIATAPPQRNPPPNVGGTSNTTGGTGGASTTTSGGAAGSGLAPHFGTAGAGGSGGEHAAGTAGASGGGSGQAGTAGAGGGGSGQAGTAGANGGGSGQAGTAGASGGGSGQTGTGGWGNPFVNLPLIPELCSEPPEIDVPENHAVLTNLWQHATPTTVTGAFATDAVPGPDGGLWMLWAYRDSLDDTLHHEIRLLSRSGDVVWSGSVGSATGLAPATDGGAWVGGQYDERFYTVPDVPFELPDAELYFFAVHLSASGEPLELRTVVDTDRPFSHPIRATFDVVDDVLWVSSSGSDDAVVYRVPSTGSVSSTTLPTTSDRAPGFVAVSTERAVVWQNDSDSTSPLMSVAVGGEVETIAVANCGGVLSRSEQGIGMGANVSNVFQWGSGPSQPGSVVFGEISLTGKLLWSEILAGAAEEEIADVRWADNGDAWAAGAFSDRLLAGDRELIATRTTQPEGQEIQEPNWMDGYVIHRNVEGQLAGYVVGGSGDEEVRNVVIADDRIWVTGTYTQSLRVDADSWLVAPETAGLMFYAAQLDTGQSIPAGPPRPRPVQTTMELPSPLPADVLYDRTHELQKIGDRYILGAAPGVVVFGQNEAQEYVVEETLQSSDGRRVNTVAVHENEVATIRVADDRLINIWELSEAGFEEIHRLEISPDWGGKWPKLAMNEDWLVVGLNPEIIVYRRGSVSWEQAYRFDAAPSVEEAIYNYMGCGVSLDGDLLAVGVEEWLESGEVIGPRVYHLETDHAQLVDEFVRDAAGDGSHRVLDQNVLLRGSDLLATGTWAPASGYQRGLYVFQKRNGGFALQQQIALSTATMRTLSLDSDWLSVEAGLGVGAARTDFVMLYYRTPAGFAPVKRVYAPTREGRFGSTHLADNGRLFATWHNGSEHSVVISEIENECVDLECLDHWVCEAK